MRRGALLRPHLHDAIIFSRDIHHHATFANRQRERLFDVDIFAGLTRRYGRQRVPMIGSSDNHRINIFVVCQPPKIFSAQSRILIGLFGSHRRRFFDLRIVYVTERDTFHIRNRNHFAQISRTLSAASD